MLTHIKVTDDMKTQARAKEADIKKALKQRGKNYTNLKSSDRYYIGTLGELAFEQLLKDNNKKYEYQPRRTKYKDDGDFDVYLKDTVAKVDVKTCSKYYHGNVMMPKSQYDRYTYNAYIGIRIVDDTAEIHGWCYKTDFKQSRNPNLPISTMEILLKDLKPMSEMLDKILTLL